MNRPSRSGRLVVLVLALLATFVAAGLPAQADDPIPTKVHVFTSAGPTDSQIGLNARVTSGSGVPTGTVVFFLVGQAAPLTGPVAVDATGLAKATVPQSGGIFASYRAEFTGTNGYADSQGAQGDGGVVLMDPQPTILQLGGPSLLKLNLTMSAYMHYTDGSPAEGESVYFTLLSPAVGASGHPQMSPFYIPPIPVCTAVSGQDGIASCKGAGTGGAILSILTLGAWANQPDFFNYYSVHEPVIVVGK